MKELRFDALQETYFEEILPNGLRIRVIPRPEFAKTYSFFATNYGSIDQAFTIPCNYEVAWELTLINDYTKVYSAYGIQAYRYVNWETQTQEYTSEQYAQIKADYEAGK